MAHRFPFRNINSTLFLEFSDHRRVRTAIEIFDLAADTVQFTELPLGSLLLDEPNILALRVEKKS